MMKLQNKAKPLLPKRLSILTRLLLLPSQNNQNDQEKGFSLIEMIASTVMGTIILGFALGGFFSMRQTFVLDKGGADVNQRLKTVLATMSPDMQQVGQGLTDVANLPLVELEVLDGSSVITTRKVIVTKPLTPKNPLAKNTTNTTIEVMEDNATFQEWQNARINNGGTIEASIFDSAGNRQVFQYTGENIDTSVTPNIYTITIANTTWTADYPPNSDGSIYLMDKRKYEVKDNTLTLTVNDKDTFKLVEYVEKLNIFATISSVDPVSKNESFSTCTAITNGVTPEYCDTTPVDYKFKNIRSIDVIATVLEQGKTDPLSNNDPDPTLDREKQDFSMSQKFFPRNTIQ